jgi:RimJ/RimL family protein N-acetyltransferase
LATVDWQPHLIGALVELRPLRAADLLPVFAAASDPLIWEQHPVPDRYREGVFRPFFSEQLASGGGLVALDRRTRDVIGTSRFFRYDPQSSEVEIGFTFLVRRYWGGAYNGEMKSLMLTHAFRHVRNVMLLVDPQNTRSQRAVEKIGGIRVGTRINAYGDESVAYRITSAEWAARKPAAA